MTWVRTSRALKDEREKETPRRIQICGADARRKVEQPPPAMHRDPRAIAFLEHVFHEAKQAFCDMAVRKVNERDGRD